MLAVEFRVRNGEAQRGPPHLLNPREHRGGRRRPHRGHAKAAVHDPVGLRGRDVCEPLELGWINLMPKLSPQKEATSGFTRGLYPESRYQGSSPQCQFRAAWPIRRGRGPGQVLVSYMPLALGRARDRTRDSLLTHWSPLAASLSGESRN